MSVRTRSAALLGCALVLAVSVTWLVAGAHAQLGVGWSCASGGPYQIAAPCPEHTTSLVLTGMFVSVPAALAGTVFALPLGAPNLVVPYWTAILLGLGGAFLVADGMVIGLLFVLMAAPGLYLMTPWQRLYTREPVEGAPLGRNGWWLVYLVVGAAGVGLGAWTASLWL